MSDPVRGSVVVSDPWPRRVVCLTEETVEVLYAIGEGDRVVGVSGYTERPPEAREKPVVCAFVNAKIDDIVALEPDLVLGFSDLQAGIAADLIRRGVAVHVFNQRSVEEILQAVRTTCALVGRAERGQTYAEELRAGLERLHAQAAELPRRPRVFFEEWHDPLISGIRWVAELIELVGGEDVCPEARERHDAKGRVFDPAEIARRNPDVIVGSWCGKRMERDLILARAGFDEVRAVQDDQIYEIASSEILQPGPAALTDGASRLARIVSAVARGERLRLDEASGLRRAD